jgi:hypothetical protein
MIDRTTAEAIAAEWIDAWNAHDPERVVAHFADDVVVRSPVAAQLRPDSGGILRGKDAVLSYYRDGLAAISDLHFTMIDVCTGVEELTIVYRNQRNVVVAETLVIGAANRAVEVRVAYGQ